MMELGGRQLIQSNKGSQEKVPKRLKGWAGATGHLCPTPLFTILQIRVSQMPDLALIPVAITTLAHLAK